MGAGASSWGWDWARRLVGLVALWFVFSLFQPLAGDGRGEGRVSVRVPAGAGVGSIADLLEKRGVVGSAFFFQTRARLSGRAGDLKPGAYTLARGHEHRHCARHAHQGPGTQRAST